MLPEPLLTLLGSLVVLSLVLGLGYLATTVRAGRLDRQRADLLDEVGLLQTALLPDVPEIVGQVRTSVAYRPSDGPAAGGDFYDAMTLPGGRSAFILGDVCGHGRQALARTAFVRYTLRAYLEAGMEPRLALQVAGTVMDDHMGGEFATVLVTVHDPMQGTLTYASAGHPAPLVAGPARPEAIVAASSPPVGLGLRTGLRQTVLPVPPGSVVCLYTDGLAEARTERGVLGRPRLGDMLAEMGRDATAVKMLDRVAAEATAVGDDMATMVLVPTAGVTTGRPRVEQLEIEAQEVDEGMADRFLAACGVAAAESRAVIADCRRLLQRHGSAVLVVTYGVAGPGARAEPPAPNELRAAPASRA